MATVRCARWDLFIGVLIAISPVLLTAQSVNMLGSREVPAATGDEPPSHPLQIAVPAGLSAAIDRTDSATGVGPTLGVQLWQKDRSFIGVFFSFAPESEIKGQQREFGAFLLNPPFAGTSFSAAFNRVWGARRNADGNPWFLWGPSGRIGVTRTRWTGNVSPDGPGDPVSTTAIGDVAYANANLLVMSRTFQANEGGNEYQFGAEIGGTLRFLVGDLAAAKTAKLREAVIGSDARDFHGLEVTLFARLNSAQPFVRISRVGKHPVDGLQGWQTFFGVTVLSALFQDTFETLQILTESTALTNLRVGRAFETRLQVSGGKQPYSWVHVSGTLPDGVVLTSDGRLIGTPKLEQAYEFTVQAFDVQRLKSKPKTLKVQVAGNVTSTESWSSAPITAAR